MNIVTVGIDLAKNVFALHGVDQSGKAVLIKPKVVRGQLLEMVAHLPPCLIGMEACSGAHYWAREFSRFGHTVKLMAPKFVAPYRMSGKRGKNDAADAPSAKPSLGQPCASSRSRTSINKPSSACTAPGKVLLKNVPRSTTACVA